MKFYAASIFLTILIFLSGCYNLPIHSRQNNPQAKIQKSVHLDPEFSGFERKMIERSIGEWSLKTNGFVLWTFQDWPLYSPTSPLFPFMTENVCTKHLLVMRMNSSDQTIMDIEFAIGYTIAGYARGNDELCGTETIFLVMDRINSLEELRLVVLHEIGHNLKLKHNTTDRSIMTPRGWIVNGIMSKDFENFCKIWNCDPKEFGN